MNTDAAIAEAVEFLSKYQDVAHVHVVDALTLGTLNSLFAADAPDDDSSEKFCRSVLVKYAEWLAQRKGRLDAVSPAEAARGFVACAFGDVDELPPRLADFFNAVRPLLATQVASSWPASHVVLPAESRRHAGVKKSHEVERMAPFVDLKIREWLARQPGTVEAADVVVVDIGAGQGYLTCELAGRFGYTTVAVERDDVQQHGTLRRSALVLGVHGDGDGEGKRQGVVHVVKMMIDKSTVAKELEQLLIPLAGVEPTRAVFVLVSLHACGSLSANMLRLFHEWPKCCIVVNVGCCYNLIGEGDFPLSTCAKEMFARFKPSFTGRSCSADLPSDSPMVLTKNMLMAACQAPQKWLHVADDDEMQLERSLEANARRCALQLLLHSALGCDDLEKIGRVSSKPKRMRSSENDDPNEGSVFWDYCASTVRKVLQCTGHCEEPALAAEEAKAEQEARKLASVHLSLGSATLLRLSLLWGAKAVVGSSIEGLILRDREQFIRERCGDLTNCCLVPLFDPRVSPRFVAVFAQKK